MARALEICVLIALIEALPSCSKEDPAPFENVTRDLKEAADRHAPPAFYAIVKSSGLYEAELIVFSNGEDYGAKPLNQKNGLTLLFGTSSPKFPANQTMGRFHLGQSIEDIYRGALLAQYDARSQGQTGDQKCALPNPAGSIAIFAYVPQSVHVEAEEGTYEIGFERVGEYTIVSSIEWHPAKKAMSSNLSDYFSPSELIDKLKNKYGSPIFDNRYRDRNSRDMNAPLARWCTTNDKSCIIEHASSETENASISISFSDMQTASAKLFAGSVGADRKPRYDSLKILGDAGSGCKQVNEYDFNEYIRFQYLLNDQIQNSSSSYKL